METKELTKSEIKERIIELNYYILSAIDINDKLKINEIKNEISLLIKNYLNND